METLKKDYPTVAELRKEILDENHCLKKMLRLVGKNKRVIDFGCATGYFSQLLIEKGCKVTGVELNPDAAKVAAQYCEQVIVADLDLVSLTEILPSRSFDIAIFGDVLEHLRDPWRVLKETHQLLDSQGYVVASIPNIAHGAIRLSLLQGRFDYTEHGILDNTHLRFFTSKTVEELFEDSGYFVEIVDRTKLPIFSEGNTIPYIIEDDFNRAIVQRIEREEEAETLQFILRGFPGAQGDKYAALKEKYFKLVDQLNQSQVQLQHTHAEWLRCESQTKDVQAECQTELKRVQSQLQHTQAEWLRCESQTKDVQAECRAVWEKSQSQLQQRQVELEQLQFQLLQTQIEGEQLQSQLLQTQTEGEQLQFQLLQTQTEGEQLQSQLLQTQTEGERSQFKLQHTQTELEQSQAILREMESSKFWKLRTAYSRLKRHIHTTLRFLPNAQAHQMQNFS